MDKEKIIAQIKEYIEEVEDSIEDCSVHTRIRGLQSHHDFGHGEIHAYKRVLEYIKIN